jgi:aminoglycoside phosphotransferase family enzyme
LEKRRFFCNEEVRLNRRLAAISYLDVLCLTCNEAGELALSGNGEVVEWLVEMMRLDEAETLESRLRRGLVTRSDVEELGRYLADFYSRSQLQIGDGGEYLQHLRQEQKINQLILYRPDLGLEESAAETLAVVDAALESSAGEIECRIAQGLIVEGHGDLRPEHVFLLHPPQIIDCLEFNRSMRLLDPYDEVNYLGIECEMLGAPWARPLLLEVLKGRLENAPSPQFMAMISGFRGLLRARLSIAHFLEGEVRQPEKWRPLAVKYLEFARSQCLSLQIPAGRKSSLSCGGA